MKSFAFAALLSVLLVACDKKTTPEAKDKIHPPMTQTPEPKETKHSSMAQTAEPNDAIHSLVVKIADQFFLKDGELILTCDEISDGRWFYVQHNKAKLNFVRDILNDADKLNGLEWREIVDLDSTAERVCNIYIHDGARSDQKWGQWRAVSREEDMHYRLIVTNKNGKVELDAWKKRITGNEIRCVLRKPEKFYLPNSDK